LAKVEYRAKSAEGKVRHPFFKGLRRICDTGSAPSVLLARDRRWSPREVVGPQVNCDGR
jgi:hypothetical protein